MAANLFSPLSCYCSISNYKTRENYLSNHNQNHNQHHPFAANLKAKRVVKMGASVEEMSISSELATDLANHLHENPSSVILMAESVGYSVASYYTSLGLFVISVPGLWSLIKRSVKSKVSNSESLPFCFVTRYI